MFRTIINGIIEEIIEELYLPNNKILVSDLTKVDRKGNFIKESIKFQSSISTLTKILTNKSTQVPKKNMGIIEPLEESDPNFHIVKIYLLETSQSITVECSKENTIDELIKHIYLTCINMANDDIQLPYKSVDGYDLRLIYDEQPIFEMDPLDNNKKIGAYDLDAAGFCAKKNYKSQNSNKTGICF